jgi:hypothetical protein
MKSLCFAICLASFGCGGLVVYQADDSDGGGGSSSSSPPPVGGGVSTGPQPPGCTAHVQCGVDELCIFETGECAPSCESESCDTCGVGKVCNFCASSACPECTDCRSACLDVSPTQCDDDDPCGPGFACDFSSQTCLATCDINGFCAGDGMVCEFCSGGSCCGCLDCVDTCVGGL